MNIIYTLNNQHFSQLHALYQQQWWSKGRTLKETAQCVKGSQICIAIIDANEILQGFVRVITDYTFKAFIFDVIVCQQHRNKGLGDKLINLVKNHPELKQVKHFELYCLPELEKFYAKHNFTFNIGNIHLMRYVNE